MSAAMIFKREIQLHCQHWKETFREEAIDDAKNEERAKMNVRVPFDGANTLVIVFYSLQLQT